MVQEKKFYLTKKGLEELEKQYSVLKGLRIAKSKGEAPKTWESEDLNSDYLSFQEDLNLLEVKITELENILKDAEIIRPPSKEKAKFVNLGATVVAEVDGNKDEFTIVGTFEANPALGKISNESPVGQALLGHKIGEEITLYSPIKKTYKIKKIKYN